MAEGFFLGNDQSDPRVNPELRKRIALALLQRQTRTPKNFGEGLTAIGEALGERRLMKEMEDQDIASNARVQGIAGGILGTPGNGGGVRPDVPAGTTGGQARSVGAQVSSSDPSMIVGADDPSPLDPPSGAARDAVIRTTLAEAGNQGPTGMNAVASVIRNRSLNAPNMSPTAVVTAPNQFEPWNTEAGRSRMAAYAPDSPAYTAAGKALDAAYAGNDPTGGATHFYAPKAQAALGRPAPRWDDGTGQTIGDHRFFGGSRDAIAAQLAQQGRPPANVQVASLDPQAGVPRQPPPGGMIPGSAPVVAPGLQQPPPQQVAQATPSIPGIQKAPPPQQQYPADYVTDPGPAPVHPGRLPPTEIEQRTEQAIRGRPQWEQEQILKAVEVPLQRAVADRTAKQAVIDQEHKDAMIQHRALELKSEELKATAYKRNLDAENLKVLTEKAKAEVAAGKVPTTRSINGVDVQWMPEKNAWGPVPGALDKPNIDTTDAQSKDLATYQKGRRALYNMGDGSELHNWIDWYGSALPGIGNAISSLNPKFQTQYNAAEEFANIALRKETGQGANASEIASVIKRYTPKPGSSPELIEQMRRSREAVLEATRDGLGKATPLADRFDKKFADEVRQTEAAKAAAEKAGKPFDVKDLPPTVVSTKEEKDALPVGRRYRLPGDAPDVHRVKKND